MPQQQPSRIERVAASAQALVVERFGIPLIAVLVAVVGFLGKDLLTDIKSTQARQGQDIAAMKSDIRDLGTRLDAQVIRQVDTNTKRIDNLEQRMQTVERAVDRRPR